MAHYLTVLFLRRLANDSYVYSICINSVSSDPTPNYYHIATFELERYLLEHFLTLGYSFDIHNPTTTGHHW